mgnify:CR=1 FL=1
MENGVYNIIPLWLFGFYTNPFSFRKKGKLLQPDFEIRLFQVSVGFVVNCLCFVLPGYFKVVGIKQIPMQGIVD